ncbi:major facilitator superfamily domain-containing protein [Xylogone sp. PMI_703]|nr:major facilitator superfamily domain-containing protein [Xylogone sp. PMI_703]
MSQPTPAPEQSKMAPPPRPASESKDLQDLDSGSIHSSASMDIEPRPKDNTTLNLAHMSTHASNTHEAPIQHHSSHVEIPDEIYDRLPPSRKLVIVALLSFCSFLAPISSTTVLAAVPEVADTFNTTGDIINVSNALYLVCMGLSPCFWGPLSQVYGRRIICIATAFFFTACSVGTAAAPNLAAFFVFRMLTAFEGTSFLNIGASCIGDIYRPTERGTAMGWFFSGTLIGPAFGPFLGGIIVTYTSWRVIFYVQTGLAGVALIGSYFLLPETIHHKKADDLVGLSRKRKAKVLWTMCNPLRVIKLFRYPNLITVGIASSSLVWNMYSLLTPIRYVLNPRFHLTSPIQSGLFYLAPGCGYMVGTFMGGRYADYITIKYTRLNNGVRIPEDRLRSALPFVGVAIPIAMLIYGWCIEYRFGGVALPVIMMFLQGVAQLFCFPSLNTYCLDVLQDRGLGAEVIAGNYMIRYFFAAAGSAVCLPAITKIGVGAFSSISAGFLVVSGALIWIDIKWGPGWRESITAKERAAREEKFRRMAVEDAKEGVEIEKGAYPSDAKEKDMV